MTQLPSASFAMRNNGAAQIAITTMQTGLIVITNVALSRIIVAEFWQIVGSPPPVGVSMYYNKCGLQYLYVLQYLQFVSDF
jgi:hypothetical protein